MAGAGTAPHRTAPRHTEHYTPMYRGKPKFNRIIPNRHGRVNVDQRIRCPNSRSRKSRVFAETGQVVGLVSASNSLAVLDRPVLSLRTPKPSEKIYEQGGGAPLKVSQLNNSQTNPTLSHHFVDPVPDRLYTRKPQRMSTLSRRKSAGLKPLEIRLHVDRAPDEGTNYSG